MPVLFSDPNRTASSCILNKTLTVQFTGSNVQKYIPMYFLRCVNKKDHPLNGFKIPKNRT